MGVYADNVFIQSVTWWVKPSDIPEYPKTTERHLDSLDQLLWLYELGDWAH